MKGRSREREGRVGQAEYADTSLAVQSLLGSRICKYERLDGVLMI
jgi:hypothetical protein